MKKILSIGAVLAGALMLAGCGERVEIPPGFVGKVMTAKGYKEGVHPPSKTRLEACWNYCDKMILLQVSDFKMGETMRIFMPEDKLELGTRVEVGLMMNPERYDYAFAKVPPNELTSRVGQIDLDTVYSRYAEHVVKTQTREFLTKYSIGEISSNMETINQRLSEQLTVALEKHTPFVVRYVGMTDIKYPDIITKAQEASAERREAIAKEEAELRVRTIRLENKLKEAQLQRSIDVEQAEAEAAVNAILADSITPAYIRYRELNALDAMAKSNNKVFVPAPMLDSMAGQVALGGAR